jgi:UDP-N-acetyl-D-galactosamine dehydrogenase
MGITFKENVSDIRNSKVVNLIHELEGYSLEVDVIDPYADAEEVEREYGVRVGREPNFVLYDGIVIAVGHSEFRRQGESFIEKHLSPVGVVCDLKGVLNKGLINGQSTYWRL